MNKQQKIKERSKKQDIKSKIEIIKYKLSNDDWLEKPHGLFNRSNTKRENKTENLQILFDEANFEIETFIRFLIKNDVYYINLIIKHAFKTFK